MSGAVPRRRSPVRQRIPRQVPVLEVGGTHVTGALVDLAEGALVPGRTVRESLEANAPAERILTSIETAAAQVEARPDARWGIAIPGPFDYQRGIGRFEGVGKFESLSGVDVGAKLRGRLRLQPDAVSFLNDADAFGVGEYTVGAASGHARAVCITLGTGVGSAFLDDGEPVNGGPLVPPDGSVHLLNHAGRPLEETVSRRAIRTAYARRVGLHDGGLHDGKAVPDVSTIGEMARAGDTSARTVWIAAFEALGRTVAPWLAGFGASALVVGGSMTRSWDLIEAPLRTGLAEVPGLPRRLALLTAARPDEAPLLGAARWAVRSSAARCSAHQ